VIVRSPAPGGVLSPGAALRVAFRLAPGSERLAARLHVDGEDVTDACAERVAPTAPASRVELLYAPDGGWAPGPHVAAVVAPGVPADAWSFTVS
jgi:hypothetical protein